MDARLYRLGPVVLIGFLFGLALVGCSGSAASTNSNPQSAATATSAPEPTPTVPTLSFLTPGALSENASPTSTPTSRSSNTGVRMDPMEDDLFSLGESIFRNGTDKKDQIGCQYCHGEDAKGNIGPNIRGKTAGDVGTALQIVDAMSFLRLDEMDIEAVAEYLGWLATQP